MQRPIYTRGVNHVRQNFGNESLVTATGARSSFPRPPNFHGWSEVALKFLEAFDQPPPVAALVPDLSRFMWACYTSLRLCFGTWPGRLHRRREPVENLRRPLLRTPTGSCAMAQPQQQHTQSIMNSQPKHNPQTCFVQGLTNENILSNQTHLQQAPTSHFFTKGSHLDPRQSHATS